MKTIAQIDRYKRSYQNFRKFGNSLASIILLLITTILAYVLMQSEDSANYIDLSYKAESAENKAKIEIAEPIFYGFDSAKLPFTILAKSAHQHSLTKIELLDMVATFKSKEQKDIVVSSDIALYSQSQNKIDLSQNVKLVDDQGNKMTTDYAHLDLTEAIVDSDHEVTVEMNFGILSAMGFTFDKKLNKMSFKDNIRLVLK